MESIVIHRCQRCGIGCKLTSYNKHIVNEIPEHIFENMLSIGSTCEDVYIQEDYELTSDT